MDGLAYVLMFLVGTGFGVFVTAIAIIVWSERRYYRDEYQAPDWRDFTCKDRYK